MTDFCHLIDEFPVPPRAPTWGEVVPPTLTRQVDVILFDIYGTLVSPHRGDLDEQTRGLREVESFTATAKRFGFSDEVGRLWMKFFFDRIEKEHRVCRSLGIAKAEVLVERIWHDMILAVGSDPERIFPQNAALYREMVANPVALFSGVDVVLPALKAKGFRLGIASNSQFYTLPILEKLLNIPLDSLFDQNWLFLSYQLGFAKPDPHFFRLVRTQALRCGLEPDEVLMIGNDFENDVQSAIVHGLQAVHFLSGSGQEADSASGEMPRIHNFESLLGLEPRVRRPVR